MEFEVDVTWRRGEAEPFVDNRYSRVHDWRFDGGASVKASASPHVVPVPMSDPAGVDPEEALVAAISSCHMLYFLSLAARQGYRVDRYEDHASGVLRKGESGRQWVTEATIRPAVTFGGDKRPTAGQADQLHHQAHELCFIANSVKTRIAIEGRAEGLAQ